MGRKWGKDLSFCLRTPSLGSLCPAFPEVYGGCLFAGGGVVVGSLGLVQCPSLECA